MKGKFILLTALITLIFSSLLKAQSDGTLDTSFIIGTGFENGTVNTIALQNDGKILIGGSFTRYNGVSTNHIVRLNYNGDLDSSFNIGNGFSDDVEAIALQTYGKILVGGKFQNYYGSFQNWIVRLNNDGSKDTSFKVTFNGVVRSIKIQTDGKILLGGSVKRPNGTSKSLLRLNTDGSIDSSFISGVGFNTPIHSILLQNDEKILIGGGFTNYNGTNRTGIIRLNKNGTLDTSFVIGSGFNGGDVYTLALQTDGKIIAGGTFTGYNGNSRNYIARLDSNGSLDSNFIIGASFFGDDNYADVRSIAVQTDQKILVGGNFTKFKNTNSNGIARLNNDGSFDTTFTIGTGFYSYPISSFINVITLQPDARILIGGGFTKYNNVARNEIVRLNNSILSISDLNKKINKVYPNPVKNILYFSQEMKSINIYSTDGRIIRKYNSGNSINVSSLQNGTYNIFMKDIYGNIISEKFIKN